MAVVSVGPRVWHRPWTQRNTNHFFWRSTDTVPFRLGPWWRILSWCIVYRSCWTMTWRRGSIFPFWVAPPSLVTSQKCQIPCHKFRKFCGRRKAFLLSCNDQLLFRTWNYHQWMYFFQGWLYKEKRWLFDRTRPLCKCLCCLLFLSGSCSRNHRFCKPHIVARSFQSYQSYNS